MAGDENEQIKHTKTSTNWKPLLLAAIQHKAPMYMLRSLLRMCTLCKMCAHFKNVFTMVQMCAHFTKWFVSGMPILQNAR